ncbi:MAG: ABC transporter permease [Chloroflexi bacterium]|nr:MAG: ABC transporter permease [Chloroflexota bacterium]
MSVKESTQKSALLASQARITPAEYIQNYIKRVSSGDLGSIPIILGLLLIAVIFQWQNENFLTARNFVNLIVQMAGITTIAYGVVFVLLLGEIDLSIGYVSAVAAVTMTLLLREPSGWPWYAAMGLALLAVAGIGLFQGLIVTRFQVPSFVVTLAGLLAWNGVVLIMIGGAGTVIIQDKVIIGIANYFLPAVWGWIIAVAAVGGFAVVQVRHVLNRQRHNLPVTPMVIVIAQIVGLAVLSGIVVYVANQDRGVPFVGVILLVFLAGLSFLATRTPFGRYVYAVGGNKEAARRAGIPVERIRVIVFMISSVMAGFGGIILASRLRSVDTAAGGGNLLLNSIAAAVIGGTSLFGGSGRVSSAVLGALVIASVENGMGLLGLSSGVKFVVTGLVLLIAVLVDALSRQSRSQSGLA